MSQYLVLGAGILVIAAAGLTLFGAVKGRITMMLWAMTVMELLLGLEQLQRQPHWVPYTCFAAAGLCAASILVRRMRGERA